MYYSNGSVQLDSLNDLFMSTMKFGDIRGKFLAEKAMKLKIPKYLFGLLQKNITITLDDGTIV